MSGRGALQRTALSLLQANPPFVHSWGFFFSESLAPVVPVLPSVSVGFVPIIVD